MAVQSLDYRRAEPPKIDTGVPVGRGFRHSLQYQGTLNLGVADDIYIIGRVPSDEHWYVKQWYVIDGTGPLAAVNGWESQTLRQSRDRYQSPAALNGVPAETGTWTPQASPWPITWSRWWDGVTPVRWDDSLASGFSASYLIVRCTDPVWSAPRWDPGMQWSLECFGAEGASGALRVFAVQMEVIRFRLEDADLKHLAKETGPAFVAVSDIHQAAHRPQLGN